MKKFSFDGMHYGFQESPMNAEVIKEGLDGLLMSPTHSIETWNSPLGGTFGVLDNSDRLAIAYVLVASEALFDKMHKRAQELKAFL